MDDVSTERVAIQDTDVEVLYRKGLENYLEDVKSERRFHERSATTNHGAALTYENISEKEAPVLRRLLRSGPPVKELWLHEISPGALKLAFDGLEECPSLRSIHFHIDLKGSDLGNDFWMVFKGLDSLELSCENPGRGFAKEIRELHATEQDVERTTTSELLWW
ncbi:hypothetical protein MTO96_023012 [Rhipicephalus appendiculatus]